MAGDRHTPQAPVARHSRADLTALNGSGAPAAHVLARQTPQVSVGRVPMRT